MASPSAAGPLDAQVFAALREFCAQKYESQRSEQVWHR